MAKADPAITASRVPLGKTGLEVSPIACGTWQANANIWGQTPDETLIAAVRHAFDVGINFLDTAPTYGEGRAEQLLGKACLGYSQLKSKRILKKSGLRIQREVS